MPTTILDGETYEQAKHRRFREEAEYIAKYDNELLTYAAKSVGIDPRRLPDAWPDRFDDNQWNPLIDAADRYNLVKALRGNLYFSGRFGYFEVESNSDESSYYERFIIGDEVDEAYAIVKVAADIGRNM